MRNDKLTTAATTLAMTGWVAIALSGCGQTNDWIKGRTISESHAPGGVGASEIDIYVAELGMIASGDPAAQAEIYADAAAAAQLTPDAWTNLRFGLVLAIPGHPGSDAEHAQSVLREVLAQKVLLTPAEISLATIHLNNVERQIVADSESRQQQLSTSHTANRKEKSLSQRLAATEALNRELQQALTEAEQKLEAITSIERSIREQE